MTRRTRQKRAEQQLEEQLRQLAEGVERLASGAEGDPGRNAHEEPDRAPRQVLLAMVAPTG